MPIWQIRTQCPILIRETVLKVINKLRSTWPTPIPRQMSKPNFNCKVSRLHIETVLIRTQMSLNRMTKTNHTSFLAKRKNKGKFRATSVKLSARVALPMKDPLSTAIRKFRSSQIQQKRVQLVGLLRAVSTIIMIDA